MSNIKILNISIVASIVKCKMLYKARHGVVVRVVELGTILKLVSVDEMAPK